MEDKKHTALTLAEAKSQLAEQHGFKDWEDLRFNADNFQGLDGIKSKSFYSDEAAELYAASLTSELKKKEEEIEIYREALSELQRFVPSLSRLADDHLQYPNNCNKALAQIESALSKHQPIKKDEKH
jgi:hypothetical protein